MMMRNSGKNKGARLRFWVSRGTLLVCALMVMTALAACGRKGSPHPPAGATYPQQYPYGQ